MLTRIAPTPSGYLHLGNAVNFVLTWLAARQRDGRVLLRIDDLDADRKRPEYVADVFHALDFLQLDIDLGPSSPDDFERTWSQRHRLDSYAGTLTQLRESGTVYACGLSRKQVLAHGGTYPAWGRSQGLSLDEPGVAWRFRAVGNGEQDFVVRRRDGLPAYPIASLTDDHDFGVTHLIRGDDLRESTVRQGQLAQVLGWTDFLNVPIWHHPLLLNADGQKLAKSAGDGNVGPASVRAMRERGDGPRVIYEQVARLLNVPAEAARTLGELRRAASPLGTLFTAVSSVK